MIAGGGNRGTKAIERRCRLLWLQLVLGIILIIPLMTPAYSWAHGFAGQRFFPTTLAIEDPFVSDELSFLFSHIKEPGEGEGPAAKSTEISLDYSKRITQHFGISVGESFLRLNPDEGKSESGFGNLELGLKYQFFTNESHETILSFGADFEVGGTGTRRVGTDSFSTISPLLFFGKGLGDLPEQLKFLRPLAITGVVGPNFPTRSKNVTMVLNEETGEVEKEIERNPVTLTWGFSVQYNLQYLQSFVKDIGLGAPLNRMIVLVEFPFETCMNRGCEGRTTGFVNPGLIWFGKTMQLGVEAQIPVNERTGKNVGVLGLVHFFIDDLFPKSIGRPIFP